METVEHLIEKRTYIIIGSISVVLVIILLALFSFTRQSAKQKEQISPTPKISSRPSRIVPSQRAGITTPTVIYTTPLPFTGAAKETFSKKEIELSNTERFLRKLAPYNGVTFIMEYDYGNDIFQVRFVGDPEKGKSEFLTWHSTTYSIVPLSRFSFVTNP